MTDSIQLPLNTAASIVCNMLNHDPDQIVGENIHLAIMKQTCEQRGLRFTKTFDGKFVFDAVPSA